MITFSIGDARTTLFISVLGEKLMSDTLARSAGGRWLLLVVAVVIDKAGTCMRARALLCEGERCNILVRRGAEEEEVEEAGGGDAGGTSRVEGTDMFTIVIVFTDIIIIIDTRC